ncbi:MAG: hypothetical protein ACI4DP_07370 [Candidatus Ornithomonoglobus sp.]
MKKIYITALTAELMQQIAYAVDYSGSGYAPNEAWFAFEERWHGSLSIVFIAILIIVMLFIAWLGMKIR